MEVIEFTPSSSDGKGTPTKRTQTFIESNSGEDNPMVSDIIIPMTSRNNGGFIGMQGIPGCLLDSGCTRCGGKTGNMTLGA